MNWKNADLVYFIQDSYSRLADPAKAGPMAAYMKTDMPFFGIQKPQRIPIYREMKKRFVPSSREQYEAAILVLWNLPHREEKYASIEYARQHKQFLHADSFPVYEQLIREGAWWDLVDDISTSIVTDTYLTSRPIVRPYIERWISDSDKWIRRAAILAHNHHKDKTDSQQLFAHILKCAQEKDFFIRKAIGWALREYSYADPSAVKLFLDTHRARLSSLSIREASKAMSRRGLLN